MSANIPDTKLVSELLKPTGFNCPADLEGKTFEEATEGGGGDITLVDLTATANGTYTPDAGKAYKKAIVNVPSEAKPEQEKTASITTNGTTVVTPDAGKALSKVTVMVNVPGSGAPIPFYAIRNNTDGTIRWTSILLSWTDTTEADFQAGYWLKPIVADSINPPGGKVVAYTPESLATASFRHTDGLYGITWPGESVEKTYQLYYASRAGGAAVPFEPVDLQDQVSTSIDASTYTSPVEITPSENYYGAMKKVVVTLLNAGGGGSELRFFDGRHSGYPANPLGFWVIGKHQTTGKACCLVTDNEHSSGSYPSGLVQTIQSVTSDRLSVDEYGRESFAEVDAATVASAIAGL